MSEKINLPTAEGHQFFVVNVRKLAYVSIFTLGWYWLFTFHRSWVLQKSSGARVMPLMRALFAAFFLYALLKRVDKKIRESGRHYKWSPFFLTAAFIITGLFPLLIDKGLWQQNFILAGVLFFISITLNVLVVVSMQRAINFCEDDIEGGSNALVTLGNWLWMTPGILFWSTMFLLVVLFSLMGLDSGELSSIREG